MNVFQFLSAAGVTLALAATPIAAYSQAACTPSGTVIQLNQTQLTALFGGRLVCARPGPDFTGNPSDRWQEEHLVNLDLFDYKMGPGHPTDPRTKVGTWSAAGGRLAGVLTHNYGPGSVFSWRVVGPAVNVPGTSIYSFCSATSQAEFVRAYVTSSSTGCGGNFPPASTAAPVIRR